MSKQDWTIEPWPQLVEMPPRPDIPEAREYLTECCGSVLLNASHYARAKACVDPLAGIPDPAAYVKAMREVVTAAEAVKSTIGTDGKITWTHANAVWLLKAVDALRTLSTPESENHTNG